MIRVNGNNLRSSCEAWNPKCGIKFFNFAKYTMQFLLNLDYHNSFSAVDVKNNWPRQWSGAHFITISPITYISLLLNAADPLDGNNWIQYTFYPRFYLSG